MNDVLISLREWEEIHPEPGNIVDGLVLPPDNSVREIAEMLTQEGKLQIQELAKGLSIRTFSFIGSVRLGHIHIVVKPKIIGMPLLALFRYAYGLRNLSLVSDATLDTEEAGIQDLLILQLLTETKELIARGLYRHYILISEDLSKLQGKVNFDMIVSQGGLVSASLPCVHYPRNEDSLLNQVLKAGLKLCAFMTQDIILRSELRRQIAILNEFVSDIQLDREVFRKLDRKMNRLTRAYDSAIALIGILMDSAGIIFEKKTEVFHRIPGFLFDMNRFFQALVSRFLRENLASYTIRDEMGIRGMIRYIVNPKRKHAPTPRPDFIIMQQSDISAILDAKYRDLWERDLPRDMLYQLSMYAMSQNNIRESAIIYPVMSKNAEEAKLEIRDPIYAGGRAYVTLRPLDLLYLADLISDPYEFRREKKKLAEYLAFGTARSGF
jgi:5-methylcytosine-specific restriction enzyme subunit McrC